MLCGRTDAHIRTDNDAEALGAARRGWLGSPDDTDAAGSRAVVSGRPLLMDAKESNEREGRQTS